MGRTGASQDISSVQVAASLICADACNIEREVRNVEALQADLLHLDLLDSHFSPSMPLSLEAVRQLRGRTSLPFDVHLMVMNNEFFIQQALEIGVQRLCFHVESAFHADRLLTMIRAQGVKAGVALMPATPLTTLEYMVERLDFVMLMLINPGFADQKSEKTVPCALRKVADCRRFLDQRAAGISIEVDGRVSFETIPDLVAAGADVLVAGTGSLFHRGGSRAGNMRKIRKAVREGVAGRRISTENGKHARG